MSDITSRPEGEPTTQNTELEGTIPHSGIHHDEYPVETFDSTSLKDAIEQGLITMPDSAAPLITEVTPIEPFPEPSAPEKKSRRGLKIGATLAGVGVAAAALLSGMGGSDDSKKPRDPVEVSADDTPAAESEARPETTVTPSPSEIEVGYELTAADVEPMFVDKSPTAEDVIRTHIINRLLVENNILSSDEAEVERILDRIYAKNSSSNRERLLDRNATIQSLNETYPNLHAKYTLIKFSPGDDIKNPDGSWEIYSQFEIEGVDDIGIYEGPVRFVQAEDPITGRQMWVALGGEQNLVETRPKS
jgi:hypothetical protein